MFTPPFLNWWTTDFATLREVPQAPVDVVELGRRLAHVKGEAWRKNSFRGACVDAEFSQMYLPLIRPHLTSNHHMTFIYIYTFCVTRKKRLCFPTRPTYSPNGPDWVRSWHGVSKGNFWPQLALCSCFFLRGSSDMINEFCSKPSTDHPHIPLNGLNKNGENAGARKIFETSQLHEMWTSQSWGPIPQTFCGFKLGRVK